MWEGERRVGGRECLWEGEREGVVGMYVGRRERGRGC